MGIRMCKAGGRASALLAQKGAHGRIYCSPCNRSGICQPSKRCSIIKSCESRETKRHSRPDRRLSLKIGVCSQIVADSSGVLAMQSV
jgi:hypothetical protein